MIGTYEIKVSAARPNMPLAPMFAFKGSPSSLRIMDVPKKIGDWNITSVKVVVHYPDNTTKQTTATRNGNVWIATFEGCEVSGKIGNGLEIDADGTDENGQGVEGYVLGVGDLYILERDTVPSDIVSKSTMRYCDVVPEHPVAGDFIVVEGCAKFYDGTEWIVIDTDLSEYATKAELDAIDDKVDSTKSELQGEIDALDDKVDSTKSELLNSIASVEGEIPSKVSELTNDVGYITASAIPANLSSFNNDVGFITSSAIPSSVSAFENDAGYITANALPTKTSDLVNDSGFVTSTELENGVEKLVEDANDEHSTRVVVDEYDNVLVQKYTTGWYVSKIEVSIGTTTDYTETNEYYAYLTDVRLDTEAGRLYYTIVVQDKQRNLSPYKNSHSTPDYSTGEFIVFSIWSATQAGGQAIYLRLTVTNAETPVWVNIARLVPDSTKWSGLLDTQITPNGQFVTPTQVKPYSSILGYASRAYGSLFMFGRTSMLTPDENHFVTIDYNVGKLCYVGQEQYPWELSMYNGTTFDPPIQMNYGYWGTVGIKVNGRIRNIPINSNCWLGTITVDSRNTRPCYIKGIEDEYGYIVPDNNFHYYDTSYPITFSTNKLSIETIEGVEGGITCTRQGTGTHQTEFKYFAYEDSVPTKTSDLTNDSGFITATALTPYREKSDLYYEHSFHKANWQNIPRFIMDYNGTQTIFDKFDSTLNRWNVSTGTSDWFVEMTFVGMEADPQFTLMRLDMGIENIQPTEGAGTTTVTFTDMGIEGTFTMDMSDQLVCKMYIDRQLSALEARISALENN